MVSPVVAVNTLSVSDANEGIRTMLVRLLPALAAELPVVLIRSPVNRHLFEDVAAEDVIEVTMHTDNVLSRIRRDQFDVPRLAAKRADVLVTPSSVGALRCPIPQVVVVAAHLALPSCRRLAGELAPSVPHRVYYGPLLRASLHRATEVLAISQFLADGLVDELGVDPTKVGAMPLGVDPVAAVPPQDARDPLALFVGTLYPYKDARVAIQAFARARQALAPGAKLVVVGRDPDGGQREELLEEAAAVGACGAVELRGAVSADELAGLYARAAVLVMPSRCEGFGLPVAEAMAAGIPVVAARSTSLPEVAGGAAILIPPGDVDGFAAAIVEAMSPGERRSAMVAAGHRRAAELTWEASARILRDAIVRSMAR